MSLSVRIHPAAVEEAEAAEEWYRERSPRAADAFLHELDHTIGRVANHADQFPEFVFGTRRALLRRFPFQIIFRERMQSIEIIAIAHGRRRPGYWRNRLGQGFE